MLIDSGASLTLINSKLFHQLPYYIRRNARNLFSRIHLQLADKSYIEAQKTLLLPITIADQTRKHIVYLVPRLGRSCIIGNDFIQKHNLQIDGGRQQVYFKNLVAKNSIAPSFDPTPEKDEQYVLLARERVKIPSYHTTNIQVQTNKELINEVKEPLEYEITSLKLTPCVANGVIEPKESMNIQVANLTKRTIIVHPGQALASMTRLNEAQANVLHQMEKIQQKSTSTSCALEIEPNLSNSNLTPPQQLQLKEVIQSFSDNL
jgi:hypothetical protein